MKKKIKMKTIITLFQKCFQQYPMLKAIGRWLDVCRTPKCETYYIFTFRGATDVVYLPQWWNFVDHIFFLNLSILRRLFWVCTVCLSPTKRTLGLYGLNTYTFNYFSVCNALDFFSVDED